MPDKSQEGLRCQEPPYPQTQDDSTTTYTTNLQTPMHLSAGQVEGRLKEIEELLEIEKER